MLKLAGSFLVVTASLLYGWRVGRELQEHVGQLVGMKEMLLMLHGEISYARTPLKEAFWQIASQGKEPFSSFLEQAAEGLGGREELGLLERVGENFGYLDVQMQLKNLELYMEQAQVLIENAQKELKDRQKVARALSLMCGLFLVILLI